MIYGYVRSAGGTCPSEATLRSNLGTTTAGTDFGSKIPTTLNQYAPGNNYTLTWGTASGWTNTMASDIEYTINKTGSYDVIGDLYHGASSTPIHSAYQNGAAHYICVYGYNNTSRYFYIADSNSAAPVQYTTPYTNLGNSTQQRGIIW